MPIMGSRHFHFIIKVGSSLIQETKMLYGSGSTTRAVIFSPHWSSSWRIPSKSLFFTSCLLDDFPSINGWGMKEVRWGSFGFTGRFISNMLVSKKSSPNPLMKVKKSSLLKSCMKGSSKVIGVDGSGMSSIWQMVLRVDTLLNLLGPNLTSYN